jgi:hypothetical protein
MVAGLIIPPFRDVSRRCRWVGERLAPVAGVAVDVQLCMISC